MIKTKALIWIDKNKAFNRNNQSVKSFIYPNQRNHTIMISEECIYYNKSTQLCRENLLFGKGYVLAN